MAISPPAYDATRSPNEPDLYFYERRGCPFCGERRTEVLNRIRYHETAEANKELPDIEGSLLHCRSCGVAYSSHGCTLAAFAKFYQKSFMDLSFLNESLLQKLRKSYLKGILSEFYRPFSASRFLNALSFNVLQAPAILTRPKGLNILDVGCGFGEFMDIYRGLGNRVTGTEVIPDLVQCVRDQGMECHLGAVEEVPLAPRSFDAVLLRAVFYRTQDPARTLNHVKSLLSPNGQIALIDPSPSLDGVLYFFKKQFPQGHFYITDSARYLSMLSETFGLSCRYAKQIYGRPASILKRTRTLGNVAGVLELLYGNLFRTKPYVLSYNLISK